MSLGLPMGAASVISLALFSATVAAAERPNIVVIVADDLGYNDVSWHNPSILSPHLDALARSGLRLESAYVQPICTPTRSALMTGYHPVHTGRQLGVLWPQEPKGLFDNFTLLPEHLNRLGYRSHAVGKWHLGMCNEKYLPTSRGFESFHGFLLGSEDYYQHNRVPAIGDKTPGYDFRRDDKVDRSAVGEYSAHIFARRARELIASHAESAAAENDSSSSSSSPLFLYLPFQNVHSPLQVPKRYSDLYPNETNAARKTFSGMVSALDEAVGNVTDALREHDMFENTIIFFTADNGGQTLAGGNNFPLRGNKATIWEGGMRAASFLHAPMINRGGDVHQGLIQVTDWLPTLYSAAGGDVSDLGPIDGVDQWASLKEGSASPRTEMLYNIRPESDWKNKAGAAIRVGEWKLIRGDAGKPDGWIPPKDVVDIGEDAIDMVTSDYGVFHSGDDFCSDKPKLQLFNLTADPTEHHDVSASNPEVVARLLARLEEYEATAIPPDNAPEIEKANPAHFGGAWSPGWCRAEPSRTDRKKHRQKQKKAKETNGTEEEVAALDLVEIIRVN